MVENEDEFTGRFLERASAVGSEEHREGEESSGEEGGGDASTTGAGTEAAGMVRSDEDALSNYYSLITYLIIRVYLITRY